MFTGFIVAVAVAVAVTLGFAAYNFYSIKRRSAGTPEMKEIAAAIRDGAAAFIDHEYKIIEIASLVIAFVLVQKAWANPLKSLSLVAASWGVPWPVLACWAC